MKSRTARLGVLLLAVIGIMGTMTPPASATTVKYIVFQGTAQLDKGLGYPCTTNKPTPDQCPPLVTTTTKPGPNGEPVVNLTFSNALHAGFIFSSAVCVKHSLSTPDKPEPRKTGTDDCALTAAGVVWGWCGLSQGMGVATLENLSGTKDTISSDFKFTGVGGLLYVTGGSGNTSIYGTVSATPAPAVGGPSCTNKTGTSFLLAGTVLIITRTPPL